MVKLKFVIEIVINIEVFPFSTVAHLIPQEQLDLFFRRNKK